MMPDELQKIIKLLISSTRQDKVNWTTAFDAGLSDGSQADDFVVSMPNYSINVFKYKKGPEYGFSILGQQGETLYHYKVSPEDLEYDDLEALFFSAKKKVAKIDEIINDLQEALQRGKTIGKDKNELNEDDIPF
jgi:hypothetical protein